MLGGLTDVRPGQNWAMLLTLLVGMGLMLGSARDLNALRLGDEEALSLGVNVGHVQRRLLVAAALMSAAAVAAAGLIGFIGLLAPHLIRTLFGDDARRLVPAAALGGATLLVACDAVARSAARPVELPVGIVTALLGVPLFLVLAGKTR
jgi:iron complex transport system permease protein